MEKSGTFLVTAAEEASAILTDVTDGQVHTLASNPGVESGEVVDATISPVPPIEATWTVVDLDGRRSIPVERSEEPPTRQSREIAAEQGVGDLTQRERAGRGEIHVLTVPTERTDSAATEVVEDEATLVRAARLGAARVEVRADAGVVSVRYLP